MKISLYTSQTNLVWRRAALGIWGLIALAFLAFYLIDLRLDYIQIQNPCQGEECNWMAISAAEFVVLESWGLSPQAFAAFMTGSTVLSVAVYWLLGGLILWRQGNSRIGLAVSLALIVMSITMIADADNVAANYPGLRLPSFFLQGLGTILLFLFIYLFPNGRLVPRWASIPLVGSILIASYSNLDYNGVISISPSTEQLLIVVFAIVLFLAAGFQIYRYLRVSSPIERLQTKWVVLGLLITMLGVPLWAIVYGGLVELPPGEVRLLAVLGLSLIPLTIALPISVTVAILRYRLWDIDLIIRKTLIYFILTAALFLVFFGSVVMLQSLFGALMGDRNSALVTVVSTLAVAALFNPLRHRIQNLIDRRFYRQRYNTEKVMAAFSSTLRDEVNLDHLQNSILGVVEETMQPASVSLWMRDAGFRPGERGSEGSLSQTSE